MILWIESRSMAGISVLMFGFWYALAAIVFCAASFAARWRVAAGIKTITPVMLTPLSMIAGLLIAFLAAHVWANADHATTYIAAEANALREVVQLANDLPAPVRDDMQRGVQEYVQWVEAEDWPAMASGHASLRPSPPGLLDSMAAVMSIDPSSPGQRIAQRTAVAAIERTLEARRDRILLSKAGIAATQWSVIFLMNTLILVTIASVHLERAVPKALSLFLFSTAAAACVVLLMAYDLPLDNGGLVLRPVALQELMSHER